MNAEVDTPPAGPARPGAMLSLSVLGPFRAMFGEQELRIRNRKARAVLAYLAMSDSGEETRERLVGLLWSESPEEKARASLRQVVHELRETLLAAGVTALRAERLSLVLERQHVALDLQSVLRMAEARQVHPLLLDLPGLDEALLTGMEDMDPSFRVWVLAKRQTLQERLLRALEPALRDASLPAPQRRRIAEAIMRLDATHEEACRALMLAAAEVGETMVALRAYEQLWQVLGEDHDMEPSQATQKVVADIKSGRYDLPVGAIPAPVAQPELPSAAPAAAMAIPPPIADPLVATPRQPRLALLIEPFAVNGVPADRAHLPQGFRHDLIACLVRFREWFVVDGESLPSREATASRVSGRYAISATAYQVGDRISLVLTLRDQDSGIFVWSDRMDLRLDNWFEAQQRVVRSIAMSLSGPLSASRLAELSSRPDVSLEAFDRWLIGQSMILRFSPENWRRARDLFTEAIAEAPNFSRPYSSLVQMDNAVHIVHPGVMRDPVRTETALARARQAVKLDPTDSRAQLCLGWSFAMARHYEQAATHMDLACELNPNDSWTLIAAALFNAFCGNHDRAAALAQESLEMTLSPSRTHWGYQVSIAYLRGDDAATIEACDRAEDVIPTLPAWRAAALANQGRHAEARLHARRFLDAIRSNWFAPGAPADGEIGRWLLHLYPISTAKVWDHLRAALAAAGIPTDGSKHHDW
jgi:DNA-binding SARP family transcriptional activator/TolB-like protein